jgi:hypothetical protein
MSEVHSISGLARRWGIPPRKISDLFYARKLNEDRCPVIGGRRIIPASYVPTVERVLREVGALPAEETATCR